MPRECVSLHSSTAFVDEIAHRDLKANVSLYGCLSLRALLFFPEAAAEGSRLQPVEPVILSFVRRATLFESCEPTLGRGRGCSPPHPSAEMSLDGALALQSPATGDVEYYEYGSIVISDVKQHFIALCRSKDEIEPASLHKMMMDLKTEHSWLKIATMLACVCGNIQILDTIYNIEKTSICAPFFDGITAMHVACVVGDLVVAKWLHAHGASVVSRTWNNLEEPVHWSVICRVRTSIEYCLLVEWMRRMQDDVLKTFQEEIEDRERKQTHEQRLNDRVSLIKWLAECGASLSLRTKEGYTPLDMFRMSYSFAYLLYNANDHSRRLLRSPAHKMDAELLKMIQDQKAFEMGESLIRDEETDKAGSSKRKGKAKKRDKKKAQAEEKAEEKAAAPTVTASEQVCQEDALKEKVASLQAELDAARGLSLSGLDDAGLSALEHKVSDAMSRIGAERQKREEARREEKLCVICMSNERDIAFVPCGHVVACRVCADKLNACPTCRAPAASKLSLFIS